MLLLVVFVMWVFMDCLLVLHFDRVFVLVLWGRFGWKFYFYFDVAGWGVGCLVGLLRCLFSLSKL